MRKVRPDATLQTLPDAKQERIVEYASAHSLDATVKFCGDELKISTSRSALARFLQWYETAHIIDQAKDFANQFRDVVEKRAGGKIDHDALAELTQTAFEIQAAKTKDAKLFLGLRRLRNSERFLNLEREKFEFDAAKACLKQLPALKQIAGNKDLDENAKLTAVREKLFGEVPE